MVGRLCQNSLRIWSFGINPRGYVLIMDVEVFIYPMVNGGDWRVRLGFSWSDCGDIPSLSLDFLHTITDNAEGILAYWREIRLRSWKINRGRFSSAWFISVVKVLFYILWGVYFGTIRLVLAPPNSIIFGNSEWIIFWNSRQLDMLLYSCTREELTL